VVLDSITLGLAAAVAPGEVVGIDIDATAIQLAQDRAAKAGAGNLRFERGNVYALPFPDGSIDVVFTMRSCCICVNR
jgi:ubiquinone/menaquinone biosynthesis C-methylase UbiE